jgi:hypothetical protein
MLKKRSLLANLCADFQSHGGAGPSEAHNTPGMVNGPCAPDIGDQVTNTVRNCARTNWNRTPRPLAQTASISAATRIAVTPSPASIAACGLVAISNEPIEILSIGNPLRAAVVDRNGARIPAGSISNPKLLPRYIARFKIRGAVLKLSTSRCLRWRTSEAETLPSDLFTV